MLKYLAVLALGLGPVCPSIQVGQTYKEAKVSCPDLGDRAVDQMGPGLPVYYCPSQRLLVIGNSMTGKVFGLLYWDSPNPPTPSSLKRWRPIK